MKVKLQKISIKKFKGIKGLEIDFQGKDTNIYGDNATGKTTIYDAYLWALFDKDSQDRSDFEVLPINNKEATAEVEITLNIDGVDYAFKKTYSRKYNKKQKDLLDFTGHKIKYYVNDILKKKSEYKDIIKNIIDEKTFKLLSNPMLFNETLKWQDRRKMLMQLTTVKDKDILAENPDFEPLREPLQKYSTDDYKKKLKADIRKINDDLKEIPARIDEQERNIQDIDIDIEATKKQIKQLQDQLTMKDDSEIKAIRERIKDLNATIEAKRRATQKQITEKRRQLYDLQSTIDTFKMAQKHIEKKEQRLQELRQDYLETKGLKFEGDKCPYCGQPLPEHLLQDAIKKFNLKKSKRLEEITKEGLELKKQIEDLKKQLQDINGIETEIKAKKQEIEDLQKQLNERLPEQDEIEKLQERLEELINNDNENEIKRQITDLQNEINQAQLIENAKQRIEELKEQEQKLAQEQNDLRGMLALLEEFEIAKINKIESDINSKFQLVRFKLFNKLINGNIEETCEAMVDNVPYRNLNHGAKINAGLDIVNTLQKIEGIRLPVFIDNREAITKPLKIDTQVISLIVSEKHKTLEVNHE